MTHRSRTLWILVTLGMAVALRGAPAPAEEAAPPTVGTLLESLPEDGSTFVWQTGATLAELGDAARPELERVVREGTPVRRLAAGYALLEMGEGLRHPATRALEAMIRDGEVPLAMRRAAASLLGTEGGSYAAARLHGLLGRDDLGPMIRVAVAAALYELTHSGKAYEELRAVLDEAPDAPAAAEAAIALGRLGKYEEVAERLEAIRHWPGRLGDEAETLVFLNAKIDERIGADEFPARLISEVVHQIRERYALDESDGTEAERLDARKLATQAARALVNYVDPFSDYLDEESYQSMLDQIGSSYGGIGAYVGMRNGRFTILTPMYDSPAHKAGLKSMDVVEEIDGTDIAEMEMNDIIKMLKGPPGTKVTVSVWRRGWSEAHEFDLIRDQIELDPVKTTLLPGGIGYILLTSFNERTAEELEKALTEFESRNVKGLVLDLTNNPGGLLDSAVAVARQFIGHGKLIVYSKGKPRVHPRDAHFAGAGEPLFTGPMVVIVNEGSASASEIVAGALRDHDRAKLVGRKTFGKGSVQQLLHVYATQGRTRLKLTVAKYYLPKGESIHGKGIEPDVEVEEETPEVVEVDAILKLQRGRVIEEWVQEHFAEYEELLRGLIAYDQYDPERYPGFDTLLATLRETYPEARITPDLVRRKLRAAILNHLRYEYGEEVPVDVEENEVLQRALLVLGESLEGGLPGEPVYDAFRERLQEEERIASSGAGEGNDAPLGGEPAGD